jgi:glycosyltransferase involved in cell wall biosynthesis
MDVSASPRVSILTPVYNGADHLVECIESVLRQTYSNWDYTIVNNRSTDDTLAIAQSYATKDSRIQIINTDRLLPIVDNHNHTIRQISPDAKYCKFVFADDWLYPSCIREMVDLALRNPSVGLVGAFTMDGKSVRWHGPPHPADQIPGLEVCRRQLMGGPYVFGTMTSLLVRCDLVRKRASFFNEKTLQADMESCFELLQECDFGFVHQVLSFSREREGCDAFAARLNSQRLADFTIFLKYGPALLAGADFEARLKIARRAYYRVLAHNVLRLRSKEFWHFHAERLAAAGARIEGPRLAAFVFTELAGSLADPARAVRGARRWWSARFLPHVAKRPVNSPKAASAAADSVSVRQVPVGRN